MTRDPAPPAVGDATLPSVSVVIPNYNHARYLPRSLNAFLRQSVRPVEIVVVNDGSTDQSLEVLQELARQHPVIEVLDNERNLGVVPSMNRGLARARGDYVLFAAADDEVRSGLLERSLTLLRAHPQAGLCSSRSEWRCEASGLAWTFGAGMPGEAGYLTPEAMVALGRRGRLAISGPNTLFRRTALVEAGGWVPELRWYCDFFGAYVVGFRHGMCHLPEVLAEFNLSAGSYYHTARDAGERRAVLVWMLDLLLAESCGDVRPRIRDSGILGTLGTPLLRVVLGRPAYRGFVNVPLLRQVARRGAEVLGRRWFPAWFARWCLRVFYGRG
ncbi:MAG: glycosyltransferase family 2 protein [Verrucomicrobiales bacterium]|nr:glycosyltransferase family 2 protein [Verrucomicrobiales bacterium]